MYTSLLCGACIRNGYHSGLCRVYLTHTSLIILCAARSVIMLSLSVRKGGKFTMI